MPGGGGVAHLGEDLRCRTHAFVTAGVRHDAERAELVAALDDGHVGTDRVVAAGQPERERDVLVRVEIEQRRAAAGRGSRHERRELLDRLRADHDVDQLRPLQDRGAFLLRHAAGDGDDGPVARLGRRGPNLTQAGEQLLFGALPHAAGIDDHDIGRLRRRRRRVAVGLEQPGDALGIVDVHLAAVRLDDVGALRIGHGVPRNRRTRAKPPRFDDFRLSPSGRLSPFASPGRPADRGPRRGRRPTPPALPSYGPPRSPWRPRRAARRA